MRKILGGTVLGAVVALTVGLGSTAAHAEDGPVPTEELNTVVPMTVTGYDADVAAANGFEIVVHDDGSWESVPVTPEAQAAAEQSGAAALSGPDVSAQGTVYGNCGSAMLETDRSGNLVTAVTGYDVIAAVSNRISWSVVFVTWNGVQTLSWPSGPSPAHWRGYGGIINGAAGFANAYGDVILITGAVCGSGAPGDSF